MATNYPGSLDTGTEQPSPLSTTEMDDAGFEHDVVHTNHSEAIIALETKVGTGSSTAVADSVLAGTGSGTSSWSTAPSLAGLTVDTDTLHVDATNDRVGIGTTSPGSALHLFSAGNAVDQIRISSTGGTVSEYGFLAADASTDVIRYGYWTGSGFGNNHFEGKVGIGRNNPDTLLHVNGAVTISSDTGVGNTHFPFTDGRFYYTADPETGGTGDHVFRHYSGGTYVEQMRILENGNVGIGTASPSYTLDVSGTGRFTGNLTLDGDLTGTSNTNFFVGNDSNERILFQESSNQIFFYVNGAYRAYFTSGGDFIPYADSTYDLGTSSVRWAQTYSDYFRGSNGSASVPVFSFASDTNTGMYLVSADQLGFATGGALRAEVRSDGIHLASGDWFRSYGTTGWYNGTYGGGMYMTDTTWVRTYNNKGMVCNGIAATLFGTSSTSGYQYVMRNTTYGTLGYYTSTREVKENIVDVTSADSGAWMDALQPVMFNEKWLREEEEPAEHQTWREADVQVGFIAEDVLGDSVVSQFAQVNEEDGVLKPVGWKWECVIAAAVAEIKALRGRVAQLESTP